MKFRVFLTCCKAQCCKLFGEKINVAKAYVANILANQQCCKHKIAKNVAKKNLWSYLVPRERQFTFADSYLAIDKHGGRRSIAAIKESFERNSLKFHFSQF